nr:unnamed protein product [Spirometra erinaceieuropaei]
MKSVAHSLAYLPGIDGDIDDLVRRCSRCQQAAKMPPRQPPIPWQPPERLWPRVHIDFAGPLNGVSYLILVEAYSNWPAESSDRVCVAGCVYFVCCFVYIFFFISDVTHSGRDVRGFLFSGQQLFTKCCIMFLKKSQSLSGSDPCAAFQFTFCNRHVVSTNQKSPYPVQKISPDADRAQFMEEVLVWNIVESFAKIDVHDINLELQTLF